MATTNLLHGYYELGGETIRDASITIDEAINSKIPGVPLAIQETVPYIQESDLKELDRDVVRSYQVPAYHYEDPSSLKLPLFFVKGTSSKVEFVRTMLSQRGRVQGNQKGGRAQGLPANESITNYLKRTVPIHTIVCNGIRYQYDGLDLTGRPMGSVRLEIDDEADDNAPFFEARSICLRAIRAISSRVKIETMDSIQIGRINIQNTTSERIQTVVGDIAIAIEQRPVVAQIGNFVLKNKILSS